MKLLGLGLVLVAGIGGLLPICSGIDCGPAWYVGPGQTEFDVYSLAVTEDTFDGTLVKQYVILGCDCGLVTAWRFYARKSGTIIMYVFRYNSTTGDDEVVGFTKIIVPPLSGDNYFEIPVSSEMWISVENEDIIGFYTAGVPMITYNNTDAAAEGSYQITGASELNVGDNAAFAATPNYTDRAYAFAANVETAHDPMFLNLPFAATLYTHSNVTVIHTVSVTDLDPDDVANLTVTMSGNDNFTFNAASGEVTYANTTEAGVSNLTFTLNDTCSFTAAVTSYIEVTLVNEGPQFTNLPNSTTISETTPVTGAIFTIVTTDASSDPVTCSLLSPAGTMFSVDATNAIVVSATAVFDYDVARHYTLTIECTDDVTTIQSVFVVDIIKNEPPTYVVGGELPASVATDRSSGVTIYTVSVTDPEGDTLNYTNHGCTDMSSNCPFDVDSVTGVVRTNDVLNDVDAGYDLSISVSDGRNTIGPHTLSVLVSKKTTLTFNEPPSIANLPATKNVVENTPAGTYLYTVVLMDPNVLDTFTLTKTLSELAIETYFDVDLATGVISVNESVDFDTIGTTGMLSRDTGLLMTFEVSDGTLTATGTFTINIENVNEGPTLSLTNDAFTADEGPRGTVFSPSLDVTVTDPDLLRSTDTHYITTSCGVNSKYIYTTPGVPAGGTVTNSYGVYFAREMDMDSGAFPSTITCTVTVYDQKRLSDSGTITLTIENINDHDPTFDKSLYTFLVSTTDQFEKIIATIPATDADSTSFGSAIGGLTYVITPVAANSLFMIDLNGVLYVNDVSTQTAGTVYTFTVTASDTDARNGTTFVTIIFPGVDTGTTTTTTTERNFVFQEDAYNIAWLLVLGLAVVAIIIVSLCLCYHDRQMHEFLCLKYDYWYTLLCLKKDTEAMRSDDKLTVTLQDKTLESDPLKSKLEEVWPETPESERAEEIVDQWGKERRMATPESQVSETEADVHSTASDEKKEKEEPAPVEKKSPDVVIDDDVIDKETENKLLTEQWGELKLEKDVHVSQLGGALPPTIIEKFPLPPPPPSSTGKDDDSQQTQDKGTPAVMPLPGDSDSEVTRQTFPRTTRDYDEPHPSQVGELRRTRYLVPVVLPGTEEDMATKYPPHRVLSPVLEDSEGRLSRASTGITDPLHTPGGTLEDERSLHVSFHLPGERPSQPRRREAPRSDSKSKTKDGQPSDHSKAADKKATHARRKRRHRVLPEEPPKPMVEDTKEEEEPPPKPRRYDRPLPDDIVQFPWNKSLFIDKVTSGQQESDKEAYN